jgi:hypothetical protein
LLISPDWVMRWKSQLSQGRRSDNRPVKKSQWSADFGKNV